MFSVFLLGALRVGFSNPSSSHKSVIMKQHGLGYTIVNNITAHNAQ